jgi:hypothetical protein
MGKKALTKTQVKRIISLRGKGYSLPEIKRLTCHGYGTVFRYIRGVKILPQFREFWRNKQKSSIFRSLQQQKKAREEAQKLIGNIDKKDKIIIASCLYWAEGAKRDFSLTNTDPILIKTFLTGLKELGVEKERISINLRIYEDLDREKACSFWSKVAGIPKERITYVNILKGKKKGKLKYGMCRVRVIKGAYFLKLLCAIRDIIGDNI